MDFLHEIFVINLSFCFNFVSEEDRSEWHEFGSRFYKSCCISDDDNSSYNNSFSNLSFTGPATAALESVYDIDESIPRSSCSFGTIRKSVRN